MSNSGEHRAVFGMRSTIDMGRGCSDRQVSKKYVSYLHEWDRRLKKTVVAPHMEAAPHPAEINGVKVARKAKVAGPESQKEQLWSTHGKKEVAGKSHAAHPNLLNSAPLTEVERRRLTVDEARPHFSRRVSHRFNESSLSGAGVVAQDQTAHKSSRKPGSSNPGWGLSDNMTKIMTHSGQPDEASLKAHRSIVWAVAPRPNTADSIIRHRYDDPKSQAQPAQFATRTMTPALRQVNMDESRSCFLSSLNEYAANKMRGHYGDLRASTSSLSSLAGF